MTQVYTVEPLGGVRVRMVHGVAGKGYVNVTLDAEGAQKMFAVPQEWLTPVAPPLPKEPTEPGLYAINGERGAQKLDIVSTDCWLVTGHTRTFTFAEVCEMFGGPDVTIRPLVALPAVELPWSGNGPFAVEYSPRGMGSGTPHTVAVDTIGDRRYIRPSVAREMAAALLTAAGAQ